MISMFDKLDLWFRIVVKICIEEIIIIISKEHRYICRSERADECKNINVALR